MDSTSQESISPSSTRYSNKSQMKIAMPSAPSFIHPSPATSSHSQEDHKHHDSHHRVHISTPHPVHSTTTFLDKHVPLFAKHHNEFHTQHDMRAAKREARRSVVDTAIPEVDAEHLPSSSVSVAIHAVTAAATAPALADSHHALDPQAWNAILAKRQAARLRSGSIMERADERCLQQMMDSGSDSESKTSGSPAISP